MRTALALAASALLALPVAAETIDVSDIAAYPQLFAPDAPPPGGWESGRDIVLLGADLVEVAVALGGAGRILARPDAVDLPGLEDTPHRMRERAGVEGVTAMRPGAVVSSSVIYDTLFTGLDRIGLRTVKIDRTLPPEDKVRGMAALLGVPDRGEELVAAIRTDLARVQAQDVDGRPIRILHASKQGAGGSFSAGGAQTAVDNLIRRVGAVNAAADVGMDRYRSVTPEGMLLMAPDVVIVSEAELDAFGNIDGIWADYPGLALTPAGRAKRLIIMREMHVRADAASAGIASAALSAALARMFP